MADQHTAAGESPDTNPHLFRLVTATMLTVVIVSSQPVYSVRTSAPAIGLGCMLGIVHVVYGNGFDSSLRMTVERKDLVILAVALAIGVVVVFFVPRELTAALLHGGLAYMWIGSLTAVFVDAQRRAE